MISLEENFKNTIEECGSYLLLEDKYEYLENLNSKELVKLISEMLDFEETTKAIMLLEEKDPKKALELGKDIIKNNKGDDYLQATVWNVFFFDNQKNMIDVVYERKEEIGKTLLDEIIIDLTNHKVVISKDFLEKLRNTYMSVDNKINMRCQYEKFLEYYESANSYISGIEDLLEPYSKL